MHDAAAGQPLEARAEGGPQARDEVGVGGSRVQEERELWGQGGGEAQLGRERVQLEGARAVVQAVVVEAELAEGDEGAGRAAVLDEGA